MRSSSRRLFEATIKTAMEAASIDRRALARNTKPIPCYAVEQIPPKLGGDDLYASLADTVS